MNSVENMISLLRGIASNPSRHHLTTDEVQAIQTCIDNLEAGDRRKKLGESVDITKTIVSAVRMLQEILQEIPWP
jgi:hypothetical protein